MNQKTQQESLTFRARLKVSKALNPTLYATLASLPQSDLSDFVLEVLKDWSRGRLTERPNMPNDPELDRPTSTPNPSTDGEQSATASPPVPRQSKPAKDVPAAMLATRQSNDIPGERSAAREDAPPASNNDMPTHTLADLGIKSTDDWNDAFNYSSPPPS